MLFRSRPSHLRFVDHPEASPRASTGAAVNGRSAPPASTPEAYRAAFERVQEHLHAGDTYEVNLTERLSLTSGLEPVEAYLRLRSLNPAPYAGFLQHRVDDAAGWLLSSSPERYALIAPGPDGRHRIETRPIKGTLPRDSDPTADAAARVRLASDPRFRAENLMIVDLLRHDLATVCEPGTRSEEHTSELQSH